MPKPVLSDSLFNADDVATAVLDEANLQIANSDLGVTSVSSLFTLTTGWDHYEHSVRAYKFMGFVFINFSIRHAGGTPGTYETIFTLDSSIVPAETQTLASVGPGPDLVSIVIRPTNSDIILSNPDNTDSVNFHIYANGWYRL